MEDDRVILKYAACNNCGVIHRVTDICRSEIVIGKDENNTIIGIEDIAYMLPKNLCGHSK